MGPDAPDAAVRARLNAVVLDLAIVWFASLLLSTLTPRSLDAPLLYIALQLAYFFVLESHGGQTLGKRIFHVRVTTVSGAPLASRQVAVRNLLRVFDALPLLYASGLISLMRTGRARRQRLGDVAAGTVVVVEPGGKPLATPRWMLPAATLVATLVSVALILTAVRLASPHKSPGAEARAAGAQGAPSWCVPDALPMPVRVDLQELRRLRRSLLDVVAYVGSPRYAWGVVGAENMWSDDSPQRLIASRSANGLYPAGYETRQWAANGDDVVTDVLLFADARTASSFFAEAAGAHCRRGAARRTVAAPGRAANLTWVNPDGFRQEDVFLLRDRRVYRIADVRARGAEGAEQQAGLRVVDTLACLLPQAGCRRGAPAA
jgi:uncharacterized RDD family membrane protein YckC